MKKIIFAMSLISAMAVAPSIYALTANADAILVMEKEGGKKKKKKDGDAKCEKGKKSCCSHGAKEAAAEPAK